MGYPLGFVSKNDVSKVTAIFGLLRTLNQLIILTLSKDNAETKGVGLQIEGKEIITHQLRIR